MECRFLRRVVRRELIPHLNTSILEEVVDPFQWFVLDTHLGKLLDDPLSPNHVEGFFQVQEDSNSHLLLG